MRAINAAVISFAHFHGYSYARALRELAEGNLVAVADDDPTRGKEAAQRYGVEYYQDYRELLKRKDIDAVVITSENVKHAQMAIDAAEAGKHILCEKPLATKLEDADALIKATEKARVKLQTAFVMRYSPPAIMVKDAVKRGEIGKVVAITGTNHLKWLVSGWFLEPELSGGGSVMDHTVHLADMMRWYTESEARKVYTEIGDNIHREIKVEDNFLTSIAFENGTIGTIDGSWSRPASFYFWGDVVMEILGTEGLLLLDAFRQVLYVCEAEAPKDRLEWHYWGCDVDKEMVRDFLGCVQEDREPKATGFDGRQATEIILASYESARRQEPITLPLK